MPAPALYLTTRSGLYQARLAQGLTWTPRNADGSGFGALSPDPRQADGLLYTAGGGLHASTDGGASGTRVGDDPGIGGVLVSYDEHLPPMAVRLAADGSAGTVLPFRVAPEPAAVSRDATGPVTVVQGSADRYLYALDPLSGARIWRHATVGPLDDLRVVGGIAFAHAGDSATHRSCLYAVEVRSNAERWSTPDLGSPFTMAGGLLYAALAGDSPNKPGSLVALDGQCCQRRAVRRA